MLPITPKKALTQPKTMLIYGAPKIGKTTAVSLLPNCLLLDIESGSRYIDKEDVVDFVQVREETRKSIKFDNDFYRNLIKYRDENNIKFCVVDTITALEEKGIDDVITTYNEEIKKEKVRKPDAVTLSDIAYGGGNFRLRNYLNDIIRKLTIIFDHLIIIGHIKDKEIYEGSDQTIKALALYGKYSSIIKSKLDAIAYIYADENKRILNFLSGSDSTVAGSRLSFLNGKEIAITNKLENGKISGKGWEKIYKKTINDLTNLDKNKKSKSK